MREAVVETGIGETRALLLVDGSAVGVRVDREGPQPGDVWDAPLLDRTARTVRLGNAEAALDRWPEGLGEGALVRVQVKRAGIPERSRMKLPRAGILDTPPGRDPIRISAGPDLPSRLRADGWAVQMIHPVPGGPDALEAAGWSDLLTEAERGEIGFPGGTLRIELAAAFIAIDVDGSRPAGQLAVAAARAVGQALDRFGIGGNIVIDFPSLPDREARAAVAEAFDAAAPRPYERTALNGFGLMQVVRPFERPSIIHLAQGDPVGTAALAALRCAERTAGPGPRQLAVSRAVSAWLTARPALLPELERRTGTRVVLDVQQ